MCNQRVTILMTFVIRVVIRVIPRCGGMCKGCGGMCEATHRKYVATHPCASMCEEHTCEDVRAAHTPRTGMCERDTYLRIHIELCVSECVRGRESGCDVLSGGCARVWVVRDCHDLRFGKGCEWDVCGVCVWCVCGVCVRDQDVYNTCKSYRGCVRVCVCVCV